MPDRYMTVVLGLEEPINYDGAEPKQRFGFNHNQVEVSVKRTVNLGNYESITLEAGVEENIPEGKLQSEHVDFMFQKVNKYWTRNS